MIEKEWRSDLILKLLSKQKTNHHLMRNKINFKNKRNYKLNLEQASKILGNCRNTDWNTKKLLTNILISSEISDLSDILNTLIG